MQAKTTHQVALAIASSFLLTKDHQIFSLIDTVEELRHLWAEQTTQVKFALLDFLGLLVGPD